MANEVAIILKAVDKASGEINKVTTAGGKLSAGFKALTGFSLGAAGGLAAAGIASQKLYQFIKSSIDETEKYVTSITDMARVLGMSTEETSRLVQASDDLFISQEKLNVAMLAASRQGIDVSIDGLKKLSGEYLALNEGAARSQFVMKTFGRSGSEMGKLLEIGANGIDAATAAIADNLIVTAKSRVDIENYKRSIDNLNDSWQGIKYTVGNEVIPVLSAYLDLLNSNTTETRDLTAAQEMFNLVGLDTSRVIEVVGKAMGATAEEIANAQAALVSANEAAIIASGGMSTLAGKVDLTTKYFSDLTASMIFNHLAANMDTEAQMQLAMQMGLVNWETYTTLGQLDELTAKYDTNGDGVITLKEKTAEYNVELSKILGYQNALKDKTVTYTFAMIQKGSLNNPDIIPPPIKPGTATGAMSSGGWTTVGERGPEVVDLPRGSRVYSNTESKQMGGGGMTQSDMSAMAKLFAVAVATEMQKANG